MRSRLRWFALVGLLATAVDVGVFLALADGGWSWWSADAIALAAAAIVAYTGNRQFTFRGETSARWVSNPSIFAATAVVAGALDMAIMAALLTRYEALFPIKSVAIVGAATIRWFVYRWVLFNQVRRDLAVRRLRPPATGRFRLSVVVPAYNEADHIAQSVRRLDTDLSAALGPGKAEIIVVDDGSSDDTAARASDAGARVVVQPRNQGKGASVRAGVAAAEGRSVVFTDADLAYPPQLVLSILEQLEQGWDMVVGSRRHHQTNTLVQARRIRELGGRFVNWLTHLVLLGHFRDTQCGIKGFRTDIAKVLFERTRIDGWAFDVELFLMAEQDQLSLQELPVTVENRPGSSVRVVTDSFALLVDLVRIRRWAGKGLYRPDAQQARILTAEVEQGLG
jgi:putative flippase GtrA